MSSHKNFHLKWKTSLYAFSLQMQEIDPKRSVVEIFSIVSVDTLVLDLDTNIRETSAIRSGDFPIFDAKI